LIHLLACTLKTCSQAAKPNPLAGPCDSRTWHFHFEHQEASSGRPRQTKPTLSPLTRSNRRHGQYVESCCALELDGILIFRRVKELVSAQPEQEGSQERVRKPPFTTAYRDRTTVARMNNIPKRGCAMRSKSRRLTPMRTQYPQAQDQQIPFAQGY